MKNLEKIVIMDGVKLSASFENLFYSAGAQDAKTPLYVYNHSTEFKNLPKKTFNNCDGIFLYTVADIGTRTDIFESLGLTSPTTWDEFLYTSAIIQRNNMNVV